MIQGHIREVVGLDEALKTIENAPKTKTEILKYQKRMDKSGRKLQRQRYGRKTFMMT